MQLKGHSLILHIYTVNTLILKDLGPNKTAETALKHTQKNEARLHQVLFFKIFPHEQFWFYCARVGNVGGYKCNA